MGTNGEYGKGLQQGLALFDDMLAYGALDDTSSDGYGANEARERARMKELDALSLALQQRFTADQDARETHAKLEADRAEAHTIWGQSGLDMDGSKELVTAAKQQEDLETESAARAESDRKERETLDKGLREANYYRINKDLQPSKSTLSLGSSIYKYER